MRPLASAQCGFTIRRRRSPGPLRRSGTPRRSALPNGGRGLVGKVLIVYSRSRPSSASPFGFPWKRPPRLLVTGFPCHLGQCPRLRRAYDGTRGPVRGKIRKKNEKLFFLGSAADTRKGKKKKVDVAPFFPTRARPGRLTFQCTPIGFFGWRPVPSWAVSPNSPKIKCPLLLLPSHLHRSRSPVWVSCSCTRDYDRRCAHPSLPKQKTLWP